MNMEVPSPSLPGAATVLPESTDGGGQGANVL